MIDSIKLSCDTFGGAEMLSSKPTFNVYLSHVERYMKQGAPRGVAHGFALRMDWPEMFFQIEGTDRDPRKVAQDDIDGWLGWLVTEWNRSTQ